MATLPAVASDRIDGWRLVDERVETPFDVRLVTVTAATAVYEDPELATAVRDATGSDGPGRFFLTSHVSLKPQPPVSGTLRKLVTDRASRSFADQLRERGFTRVERTDERAFSVAGADARLVAYDGQCPVGDLTVDVQGWLAVWETDGDFFLAGGAYPTGVSGGRRDGGDAAQEVEELQKRLEPGRFREELFELVRSVQPGERR
ncbi:hypothetical protein SAMN04487949_2378 [Halogranum gelatinilyticum]|uniref:Uncharacterized protein n=1 Tax=Halogranum gelatinilyticum TaxID=660521 RepID=A0A1G9VH64_9EURY|nr:DUF6517 family protein [Halogranum gelatinilyticum]SDM71450.1 hypothetical protein SAMN04487949_2378 [Halogranum gelatinilyticum]